MSIPSRYAIGIKPSAEREMKALPPDILRRASKAILALETVPRPPGCKKLRGEARYRVRVGKYRVLYTVDDKARAIEIVSVTHRSKAYR